MEEKTRTRKSSKEATIAKIEKIDEKIMEMNDKIKKLEEEKEILQEKLKQINIAENKAKEDQALRELRALIKQRNMSIEDLKIMLGNPKTE